MEQLQPARTAPVAVARHLVTSVPANPRSVVSVLELQDVAGDPTLLGPPDAQLEYCLGPAGGEGHRDVLVQLHRVGSPVIGRPEEGLLLRNP